MGINVFGVDEDVVREDLLREYVCRNSERNKLIFLHKKELPELSDDDYLEEHERALLFEKQVEE